MTNQEIDEQFDKEFLWNNIGNEDLDLLKPTNASVVKAFIHKVIAERDEALRNNHFCCKYQTVNQKDFCDHCLSLLSKEFSTVHITN